VPKFQNIDDMGKYLDPRADLTFKKIFGERLRVGEQSSGMHKNLVISLLNALLPLKDDERVESIEYWPADQIPERTEAEKYSIVDVCCKDNKQREFIVEMQMSWTESFKKRVLLNASKAYVAQTNKGMKYKNLQPVYALNFVNAEFLKDVDDYYHYYHLVHDKYTDKVIDGLHLIFVELPKFKPQTISERKMQVLWLRFLTEINDRTQEAPAELLENAEVSEALEILERAAFTDAEMRAYDKFWDEVSSLRTIEGDWEDKLKEAEAKAEEAKAKLKQEKFDTARKLKAMNVMTTEQISEVTGLSKAEIAAL
jgi:predicted transposase/invertase (TIGR01784 family)